MNTYIIDSIAFLSYLADNLPTKADNIFKEAEKKEIQLLLPSIALVEVLYTMYKGKEIFGKQIPTEKIDLIFQILQNGKMIQLVSMNLDAWRIFQKLIIPELHDRMIVATYHYSKAIGIVTSDPEIKEYAPSVW